ncbi:heavy-metal-associated domain-containing protein [Garicola koreensis]|uniref:Copper ion binding protein n=1 Tax=Garicola koreensis TaxID=1262554 RepID=A0A7W5Y001_9MICC|nr:cation transporter [Garicola koreensis]MBB3666713.1 copper ion binding protein [Garicola koreensis]
MAAATKNYTVEGMTCGHCKASVEEEVGEIAGVTSVEATVDDGRVAVSGDNFTDEDIMAAVKEAGYTVNL